MRNVSFDWAKILRTVAIYQDIYYEISGKNISWSDLPADYPACQVIDLADHIHFNNGTPYFIVFRFRNIENLRITLRVEDRRKVLMKRALRSQSNDYDGQALEIDDLAIPMVKRFTLTLSQIINLDSDPGSTCSHYPNKDFSSYKECDEDFVYNEMKKKYKLMPFWAAKSLDEVTNFTYVKQSSSCKFFNSNCLGIMLDPGISITFTPDYLSLTAQSLASKQK